MSSAAVPREMPSRERIDSKGGDEPPTLPAASPLANIACPLGTAADPRLTTPAFTDAVPGSRAAGAPSGIGGGGGGGYASAAPREDMDSLGAFGGAFGGAFAGGGKAGGMLGGLSDVDKWAWEMGSEAGSLPSAWSKPSTVHSSRSQASSIRSATGDGLIPGLVDGQRLSVVKPTSVPTAGGKVVVSLRKEVPQGYWDSVEIVLVNGPDQVRLKPTGIKKGKKLCIEVPSGLKRGDYDVRLSFHGKLIHGAIPLVVQDGDMMSDMSSNDDEISESLRKLQP